MSLFACHFSLLGQEEMSAQNTILFFFFFFTLFCLSSSQHLDQKDHGHLKKKKKTAEKYLLREVSKMHFDKNKTLTHIKWVLSLEITMYFVAYQLIRLLHYLGKLMSVS